MPLALAAGVGTFTLPAALGLRPVPERRIVRVDARDTDPSEHVMLGQSAVTRRLVQDLEVDDLPDGELYLHADVDVIDTSEVPDLLYQVPGGPRLADVLDAVSRITTLRRVAAGGIAATWRYERAAAVHHQALRQLSDAANPPGPERTD